MDCGCKGAVATLLLVGVIVLLSSGLFAGKAVAWTDIGSIVNRNTRYDVPYYGDTNGSAWEHVIDWYKGTSWMGNLGIGNGSRTDLVNGTTKNETLLRENIAAGAIIDNAPSSINVYHPPDKQFPEIFNEYPVECGAMYGKLIGLQAPGGHVVDMAIRTLGAEYAQPCRG